MHVAKKYSNVPLEGVLQFVNKLQKLKFRISPKKMISQRVKRVETLHKSKSNASIKWGFFLLLWNESLQNINSYFSSWIAHLFKNIQTIFSIKYKNRYHNLIQVDFHVDSVEELFTSFDQMINKISCKFFCSMFFRYCVFFSVKWFAFCASMVNLDHIVECCCEREMTVIPIGALGDPRSKERWKQNERLREESESPSNDVVAKAFENGWASLVLFMPKKVTRWHCCDTLIPNSNWPMQKKKKNAVVNNKYVRKI